MDQFHRDIEYNKEFYLRLRENYDRLLKHENMFNLSTETHKDFRSVKSSFKQIVENQLKGFYNEDRLALGKT